MYHDVLSTSASKEGPLLDYSLIHARRLETLGDNTSDLDVLMGVAERELPSFIPAVMVLTSFHLCCVAIFLFIGKVSSLAKFKREMLQSGTELEDDSLLDFDSQVERIKADLQVEKEQLSRFLAGEPILVLF